MSEVYLVSIQLGCSGILTHSPLAVYLSKDAAEAFCQEFNKTIEELEAPQDLQILNRTFNVDLFTSLYVTTLSVMG